MNAEEIRAGRFREAKRHGYDTDDVDALIERLAAAAERGEPLQALVAAAAFREARRHGYNPADVDQFLERVASAAPRGPIDG